MQKQVKPRKNTTVAFFVKSFFIDVSPLQRAYNPSLVRPFFQIVLKR